MALRQVFLLVLLFSPVSIIPLMHYTLDLFLVSHRLILLLLVCTFHYL